jgi:hypothetical protein
MGDKPWDAEDIECDAEEVPIPEVVTLYDSDDGDNDSLLFDSEDDADMLNMANEQDPEPEEPEPEQPEQVPEDNDYGHDEGADYKNCAACSGPYDSSDDNEWHCCPNCRTQYMLDV